jgi:hypothetical protein
VIANDEARDAVVALDCDLDAGVHRARPRALGR